MFRKYFEDYTPNPPPLSISRVHPIPPVTQHEITGQLLDWASIYLYQKKFPFNLITSLLKCLKNKIPEIVQEHSDLEETNHKSDKSKKLKILIKDEICFNGNLLKDKLIEKVDEICLNIKDSYDSNQLELEFEHLFDDLCFVTSVRNGRRSLEDRWCIYTNFDQIFNLSSPATFIGIFDGHEGAEAANYASSQLLLNIIADPEYPKDIIQSIHNACKLTDDRFISKCQRITDFIGGTTVLIALLFEDKCFIGWVGDSQAMIHRDNSINGLESIVNPHKPSRLDEMERIMEEGGEVISCDSGSIWRVNGILAVSRAIGDVELKKHVISKPDVVEVELNGNEDYLILATDGLWDDITPLQCHNFIKDYLISNQNSSKLCLSLAEEAKQCGSTDNITIVMLFFRPIEELIKIYTSSSSLKQDK